jgi:hypothetical protein
MQTDKKQIAQQFMQWSGIEHKVPIMLDNKTGKYITYGLNNEYPYYLLDMYRRSSKHNAIVNGKTNYIFGKGWRITQESTLEDEAVYNKFFKNAFNDEDLNDVTEKLILDLELFNGFAIAIQWSKIGTIHSYEHIPFEKIRVNRDNKGFQIATWYDELGNQLFPHDKDIEKIEPFDEKNRTGRQLFYYRVYSAGVKHYPLPEYLGALAWIEADVEIANFHNNNLRNNFWGGYLINFNNGIPTPEEQDEIERQIKRKFSGTDNAGRFVVTFNEDASKSPSLLPLTPSDMDKQFSMLNEAVQQEIFIGHRCTNPLLFGVKTEGQLGGNTELVSSYEIFKSVYVDDRVQKIERMINYLASFNGVTTLELIPKDPITQQLSETALLQAMTKEELREKAGLPELETKQESSVKDVIEAINSLSPLVANKVLESMSPNEIRALVSLPPKPEGEVISDIDVTTQVSPEPTQEQGLISNEHLRKLSGREYQNLMRIVRQYTQNKITLDIAKTMLTAGFGLSEDEINTILGVREEQQFSVIKGGEIECVWGEKEYQVLNQLGLKLGKNADDYIVLHTKHLPIITETQDIDMTLDSYRLYAFAEMSVEDKDLDKRILAHHKKYPNDGAKQMANALGVSEAKVTKRIAYLVDNNKFPYQEEVERKIKNKTQPEEEKVIEVMYKYEWRSGEFDDSDLVTSRAFCRTMMNLSRSGKVYTRKDINAISDVMGYSVWNKRGGWYTEPDGVRSPSCRHIWQQQLVVRKGKKLISL